MAVEIFLLADVKGLGVQGDVVKVADGYARNYLLPRKLGAAVTEATRRRLAKLQKDRAEAQKAEQAAAQEKAAAIAKGSYTIPMKVAEGEKLYGSVTAADIARVLGAAGFDVGKEQVLLDEPLRTLGVYEVKIRLHQAVEATVKVWIVEE